MKLEQTESSERKTGGPLPLGTEPLFAALIESSEDAILSISLDNKITFFNRAAENMFGHRREEIIGQSVFQLVPLGLGGELQDKLKRVRKGESVEHYETERIRKDGSKFHVSLSLSAVKDCFGEVMAVSWIARDISEQKKKEALIKKLSSVVEQTADAVMISDKSGVLEYVNPAFVATTGYTKEEAIGHTANLLKSGKHSRLFYRDMWKTILSGRSFRTTMINKRKNGELFYTEKTITPISVDSDEISHFVSTDKDITNRKLAEEHLRQMERRFTELFNFATDAMAYCALDGTLIEANNAFSNLTGYTHHELVNRMTYQNITIPQYKEKGEKMLKQVLQTRESCSYEKVYRRKDGQFVPALVTAYPVKNDEGSVVAIGVIIRDITDLKRQQNELENASAELARSNSELEQFSFIASHDLQEPLRTIVTYLQMIDRENQISLDPDSKKYLEFAVDGAKRLRDLIDNVHSYARVGTRKTSYIDTESADCLKEALGNLQESIHDSKAEIKKGDLPRIFADPKRITQLFQNLVGNAIKYCRVSPCVQICAERKPGEWLFKVSDNGIGIEKDFAEPIFGMFHRLHAKNEFPGSGIGLAMCKKIVEQRGGKIWVESNVGSGSTFFFTVPDALPCG